MDSTNGVALDEARDGAPEGLVVVARFQRSGRGRRGRTWEAAPGAALLVSVLLRPAGPSHLALAAVALAGADAVDAAAGFRPGLKWPNDLVVGDAKVAGLLAQSEAGAVVVGLGLNVAAAGPWPPGAASVEAVAGRPVSVDTLLDSFLAPLSGRLADPAALPSAYRRACTTLGRLVQVDLGDETFAGTAADVTDDGHLLIDVGACLRTVAAGDVVHLRPTPLPD